MSELMKKGAGRMPAGNGKSMTQIDSEKAVAKANSQKDDSQSNVGEVDSRLPHYKTERSGKPTYNKEPAIIKMQSDIANLADFATNQDSSIAALVSSKLGKVYNLSSALAPYTSASGFKADGIWGKKTHAGIVQALNLAASLLNTNNLLRLGAQGYEKSYYSALQGLLSQHNFDSNGRVTLSAKDQQKQATMISQHLIALIRFFNSIKNAAESDDNLDLNPSKVLVSNEGRGSKAIELSEEESAKLNELSDYSLNVQFINGRKVAIPVSKLQSKDELFSWLKDNVKEVGGTDLGAMKIFERYIKPQSASGALVRNV